MGNAGSGADEKDGGAMANDTDAGAGETDNNTEVDDSGSPGCGSVNPLQGMKYTASDPRHFYQRYSWPVEFVVRALKEVGHVGFSANDALTPMLNMGQQLFEPPDVNGWSLGPSWFSTGGMLARMNFASTLATNQRFELRNGARPYKQTPQTLIDHAISRLSLPDVPAPVYTALVDYVRAGGVWTGSEAQLLNKAGGVFHLLTGSGEYQFV
jgi:hypothetical protein